MRQLGQSEPVADRPDPGFVTIVRSRYGGIYEPGEWIAFAMVPELLPPEWRGNDAECERFFRERRREVGGGSSPQEAYEDLLRRLAER